MLGCGHGFENSGVLAPGVGLAWSWQLKIPSWVAGYAGEIVTLIQKEAKKLLRETWPYCVIVGSGNGW